MQIFVQSTRQITAWTILIGCIPSISSAFIPTSVHTPTMIHHQRSLPQQQRHGFHHQNQRHTEKLTGTKMMSTQSTSQLTSDNVNFDFDSSTLLLQVISGLTTYIGLVGYYDRSRGNIQIDRSCFVAKQSQVEGAGIGLYVTKALPEGTVLGTYPGVLRPSSKFLKKYESLPQTAIYTWRFTDNEYCIDPTDKNGMLPDICYGGTDDYPLSYFINETLFRFMSVPTLLARINEPPVGGYGCNVRSEEDLIKREVVFELSRDVVAGEELFMDYGLTYDRSGYDPS